MGVFVSGFSRGGQHGLGWTPDHPRLEDLPYNRLLSSSTTPSAVYLRRLYPQCFQQQVEDQLSTSSCVGNSVVAGLEFAWAKAKGKLLNFSRMGVYALARKKIGWLDRDVGCFIRDAASQVASIGICLESFHPFRVANLFKDLDQYAYAQCARHRITNIRSVKREDIDDVIASHRPVVGGFTVYQECVFGEEAQRTGYIRLPRQGDTFGGGHAVLITEYDQVKGVVGGPNSWGRDWGQEGWFTLPMDYINNPKLSDDFWTFDVL
jgi:C1A family cysteine protease